MTDDKDANQQKLGPDEQWVEVVGFPNYLVSNYGRFISKAREIRLGSGHIATLAKSESFMRVKLYPNGKGVRICLIGSDRKKPSRSQSQKFSVGRVVYEHFIGPVPKGHVVRNRDGDVWNLHPSNLYAVSRADLLRETSPFHA